jgi:hypothetical protein
MNNEWKKIFFWNIRVEKLYSTIFNHYIFIVRHITTKAKHVMELFQISRISIYGYIGNNIINITESEYYFYDTNLFSIYATKQK